MSLVVSACTPTDSPNVQSDRTVTNTSSTQSVENKTIAIGYQKFSGEVKALPSLIRTYAEPLEVASGQIGE